MTRNPTDAASALATLREAHPDWFFTTTWVAAGSGPDRRLLVAQRHGVVLSDFTAEGLTAKIAREDAR